MLIKFLPGPKIRPLTVTLLLCLTVIWAACGKNDDSPQQQVQRFVVAGEEAAEQRDLAAIKQLISDTYSDAGKRNKRDIVRVTAGYFLRHKNIHLLTRIGELTFPTDDKALVQLFVAMAGSPVTEAETLLTLQADLYRFDMVLQRQGKEWLLSDIAWRQAVADDFFTQ